MRSSFGDGDEEDTVTPVGPGSPRPEFMAADVSLRRALPRCFAKRFASKQPMVIVLLVPDADWCASVFKAAKPIFGDGCKVEYDGHRGQPLRRSPAYFVRDGLNRRDGKPDQSGKYLPQAISSGVNCVGISPDLTLLPAEVVKGADVVMRLEPLSPAYVTGIVRAVTGARRVPRIDADTARIVSPTALALALRPGMGGAEAMARIRAAGESARGADSAPGCPRLEDLHGYGHAKDWALDLVGDLRRHREDPASVSIDDLTRSALLTGPPGVGKTMLARSLAASLGIPLVEGSFADWQSSGQGHLGDLLAAMRASFVSAREVARRHGIALLLLDELDSVPSRQRLNTRYEDYWTPVVNGLLSLVETKAPIRRGVVVLAATNHAERLDAALVRPGRLDRIFRIDLPGPADRSAILRQELGADLAEEDLALVDAYGEGASGATIAMWVRDARAAARADGRDAVALADLVAQAVPPDGRTPEVLRSVAVHEAGHAVVAMALGIGVTSVNLLERGGRAGLTSFVSKCRRYETRTSLERRVVAMLAGRAADASFAQPDAGSGGTWTSDLGVATRMLVALRISYGLGAQLVMRAEADSDAFSGAILNDPDLRDAVEDDLRRLYGEAERLAEANREAIEAVATELLHRRVVSGARVRQIAGFEETEIES